MVGKPTVLEASKFHSIFTQLDTIFHNLVEGGPFGIGLPKALFGSQVWTQLDVPSALFCVDGWETNFHLHNMIHQQHTSLTQLSHIRQVSSDACQLPRTHLLAMIIIHVIWLGILFDRIDQLQYTFEAKSWSKHITNVQSLPSLLILR